MSGPLVVGGPFAPRRPVMARRPPRPSLHSRGETDVRLLWNRYMIPIGCFLEKLSGFPNFFCCVLRQVCPLRFPGILTHAGSPGGRRTVCPLHFLNSAPPPKQATTPCGSALTCAPGRNTAMNSPAASCRMAVSRSGRCWAFPASGTAVICCTGGPPWTITGPAGF